MHTFIFLRIAKQKVDGYAGVLYLHHFGTGWQELIFTSHEAAKGFEQSLTQTLAK